MLILFNININININTNMFSVTMQPGIYKETNTQCVVCHDQTQLVETKMLAEGYQELA